MECIEITATISTSQRLWPTRDRLPSVFFLPCHRGVDDSRHHQAHHQDQGPDLAAGGGGVRVSGALLQQARGLERAAELWCCPTGAWQGKWQARFNMFCKTFQMFEPWFDGLFIESPRRPCAASGPPHADQPPGSKQHAGQGHGQSTPEGQPAGPSLLAKNTLKFLLFTAKSVGINISCYNKRRDTNLSLLQNIYLLHVSD